MDFNTTIDIIIKDLREIREIIDDLKNYPGVPVLQIELAKTKCRSAEEIISLLKILKPAMDSLASKGDETNKESEEKIINIADEEPDEIHIIPERKEDLTTGIPGEKVMEESSSVTESREQQSVWPEEKRQEKTHVIRKTKKGETLVFADKFNGTRQTLLDKFSSTKDNGISEMVIKSQPIRDLKEAIGINDKFLFIREIFGGSRESYEEAIAKMNCAASYSDAMAILLSYSGEGEENEVVKQLLNIVKRKLPADE